jgi:hypothetical protein
VNEVQLKRAMADLLAGEPTSPVDARPALAHGKAARRMRRLKITAGSAAVAVALLAAAVPASRSFILGDRAQPAAPKIKPAPTPSPLPSRTSPYVGYPDSIAVIGHKTAAGWMTDPLHPSAEVRANSWATGTNPAVNSVYQRILERHPKIAGHATNLSRVEATFDRANIQAGLAVGMRPPPDLVIFQILDYDLPCPLLAMDVTDYHDSMVAALKTMQRGAPNTRVFVLSQFGRPETGIESLTEAERAQFGTSLAGFPCAGLDPVGNFYPQGMAEFMRLVHGLEGAVKAACGEFPMCRYDGGAFGRVDLDREDLATDFFHMSIQGEATAAATAWAALQHAGLMPASG